MRPLLLAVVAAAASPCAAALAAEHPHPHGDQVSAIYMIPLADLDAHKNFEDLPAPGGKVDHVDLVFNPGHAGMEGPHYHLVLWRGPEPAKKKTSDGK